MPSAAQPPHRKRRPGTSVRWETRPGGPGRSRRPKRNRSAVAQNRTGGISCSFLRSETHLCHSDRPPLSLWLPPVILSADHGLRGARHRSRRNLGCCAAVGRVARHRARPALLGCRFSCRLYAFTAACRQPETAGTATPTPGGWDRLPAGTWRTPRWAPCAPAARSRWSV